MPHITHIGTAVPACQISQEQASDFYIQAANLAEDDARKTRIIYKASSISKRHTVLPDFGRKKGYEFFPDNPKLAPFPSTADRMAVYKEFAPQLGLKAVQNTLPPQFNRQAITHLITFSCTGMYAPGLDIDLIHALELPLQTHRVSINFMGCYAAFNALKTAKAICEADPKAKVLAVGVELCTLHFQKEFTEDQLIANAIFADGAAAFLMESAATSANCLKVSQLFCDLIPDGSAEMAWHIGDFGFQMRLSSYVPNLLEQHIDQILEKPLKNLGLSVADFNHFAIHPGGKRIIQQLENALKVTCPYSYEVLKNYGNMSSITILFVLQQPPILIIY